MNTTQEPTQEKDYFWVYIAGLVCAVIVVLMFVRGGEHEKYQAAKAAVAEDSANSAYRDTSAYSDSALRK
ncbi:MAG: hypothetical protein HOP02_15125 [Methylococcaceae bacterium]|nr:hypothetical protein [Methylococcaceae bacterium]